MDLVFFHARPEYLERMLPVGQERIVSGKIEEFQGRLQITHPDHMVERSGARDPANRRADLPADRRADLKTPVARHYGAHWNVPRPARVAGCGLARQKPVAGLVCCRAIGPCAQAEADLAAEAAPRQRLAMTSCWPINWRCPSSGPASGPSPADPSRPTGEWTAKALAELPFSLTPSQETALAEIAEDMAAPIRMLRILQGDVGSGKTIVAFLAMLQAIEAGSQAAIMAPTEVLARQHFATIEPLARHMGLTIAIRTAGIREKPAMRCSTG